MVYIRSLDSSRVENGTVELLTLQDSGPKMLTSFKQLIGHCDDYDYWIYDCIASIIFSCTNLDVYLKGLYE